MTAKYEIRLSEALKEAWAIFCKSPEVFVTFTFALIALFMVLAYLPFVGPLASLLISALGPAAFFVAAEDGFYKDSISFQSLLKLPAVAPQLLMLFVVKAILIGVGFFFLVLPGIYLTVIFAFSELFVVLEGKNFLDALKASKALADHNLLGILGLCFFLGILSFSGSLLIGLGLLVTIPVSLLTLYCVFRRVNLRVVG